MVMPSALRLGPSPEAMPKKNSDVYFSVDVETDGPIPGPFSLLSFAIVPAGMMSAGGFVRTPTTDSLYLELKPISDEFEQEALAVNGLDRQRLLTEGMDPAEAMRQAHDWILARSGDGIPVLVAYPLTFDWSWLHWYFVNFTGSSPFKHSRGFDIKTAFAVKGNRPISEAGRKHLPAHLLSALPHTHHALDDAQSQADVFAKLMEWNEA